MFVLGRNKREMSNVCPDQSFRVLLGTMNAQSQFKRGSTESQTREAGGVFENGGAISGRQDES